MSVDFDGSAARKRVAREKEVTRLFRDDFKGALSDDKTRRVLWVFMQAAGLDATPFNTNAMAQSHAVGQQDAARWWLNNIRAICPEREAQMRAEANRAAKNNQPDAEDDSDD